MDLKNQRRISANVLKCGKNRVWIDPDEIEEIGKAVTRRDIRNLVKKGIVDARKKKGVSRGRARETYEQKKKGRRKGQGSRKGTAYARRPKKRRWILTIRPIRAYLKQLRNDGVITPSVYRRYYVRAKGGEFKSKNHLKTHLIMEGVIKE
ncbi:MAG: 50S ribosomal protein L19e [Candidatus Thermoplasmatota archaeon]|nr:50S ribosomal protein L19e [Candidatus Thermoplasmatota archaeon]